MQRHTLLSSCNLLDRLELRLSLTDVSVTPLTSTVVATSDDADDDGDDDGDDGSDDGDPLPAAGTAATARPRD